MNKIKTQIGTALLAAMMVGSVHSQEMEVITNPVKICDKIGSIEDFSNYES